MSTQIRHGEDPQFTVKTTGSFGCRVEAHYTDVDHLAAGGVTHWKWQSDRPIKRRAELNVIGSCFRSWYEEQMRLLGHEPTGEDAL